MACAVPCGAALLPGDRRREHVVTSARLRRSRTRPRTPAARRGADPLVSRYPHPSSAARSRRRTCEACRRLTRTRVCSGPAALKAVSWNTTAANEESPPAGDLRVAGRHLPPTRRTRTAACSRKRCRRGPPHPPREDVPALAPGHDRGPVAGGRHLRRAYPTPALSFGFVVRGAGARAPICRCSRRPSRSQCRPSPCAVNARYALPNVLISSDGLVAPSRSAGALRQGGRGGRLPRTT